ALQRRRRLAERERGRETAVIYRLREVERRFLCGETRDGLDRDGLIVTPEAQVQGLDLPARRLRGRSLQHLAGPSLGGTVRIGEPYLAVAHRDRDSGLPHGDYELRPL